MCLPGHIDTGHSTLLRNPFRMDAAFTESDRGILIVFSKMTEMKKEFQLKKKISMIILFVSAITATLLTDWSLERLFNGVFKILHMSIFFY